MMIARAGLTALFFVTALSGPVSAQGVMEAPRVLIFHKENGYVHTATPTVVATLKSDWETHGLTVESTIDSLAFTAQNLARFDVVVFLNTNYRNGPLLARAQEAAFEDYIRGGGAFVGLHSAVPLNGTMEESIWPWYADLFGARFRSHAPYGAGTLIIEDTAHFSTQGLPDRIALQDEWYALQANPRDVPGINIVATVDETGFHADSRMGGDHPVAWSRVFEGGRAWMTVVGHDMGAFGDAAFLSLVRGGVMWAAGADSPTSSLAAGPPAARAGTRGTALSYTGRDGRRIEVHVDGRVVTARRVIVPQHP